MLLDDLSSFTTLPVERIRSALSGHDIASVLPVSGGHPNRDCILAITPTGLAIVTERPRRGQSMRSIVIRWARWQHVRLSADPELVGEDASRFDLVVHVGREAFHALLEGPAGRIALRDFVVALQHGIRGCRGYIDHDAASTLVR